MATVGKIRIKLRYYSSICLKKVIALVGSFRHNYGFLVSDFFTIALVGYIGFHLAEQVHAAQNIFTFKFFISALLVAVLKILRVWRNYASQGHEFSKFLDYRANKARTLKIYNNKKLPDYNPDFGYKTSSEVREYLTGLLGSHLLFLHKGLRLGFSWYGRDHYTASLLFYDKGRGEWHLWNTFFDSETGTQNMRRSSTWPKPKDSFVIDPTFYTWDPQRPYSIDEVTGTEYRAVLSLPFYYQRAYKQGQGHSLEKGDLYALLTYTNSNPATMKNLSPDKYLRYFALEAAAIERMALRLYLDYNF